MRTYIKLVIAGAGPAGLAAAISAKKNGIDDVVIFEREKKPGGILNQCIHDGFGLIRYGEALTGPEYAYRLIKEAQALGIEIITNCMILHMDGDRRITVCSPEGLAVIQTEAVVFATGCRERTRGSIMIPGTRPAGVYTAGVAQNLINMRNIMPGKKVAILGSGDIGLIMARRFMLEGAQVIGVFEMRPNAGGLERNVRQCLLDYHITLYLKHTITKINGKRRIESVTVSEVDDTGRVIGNTEKMFPCDTLVLSVGLIPENEVVKGAGIETDKRTGGARVDKCLQTEIKGVFVCGNARKVSDLADIVSEEGEAAGRNAALSVRGDALIVYRDSCHNTLPKGVPQDGVITCIVCPKGCHMTADKDDGGQLTITGNQCPRGLAYAREELVCPKRTLTTTIRLDNGGLLSVKTKNGLDRESLSVWVERLRNMTLPANCYKCGDMIMIDGCEFVAGMSTL